MSNGWHYHKDLRSPSHIWPDADLIEHDVVGECVCGPRDELMQQGGGGDLWLRIHHSLDGREKKWGD